MAAVFFPFQSSQVVYRWRMRDPPGSSRCAHGKTRVHHPVPDFGTVSDRHRARPYSKRRTTIDPRPIPAMHNQLRIQMPKPIAKPRLRSKMLAAPARARPEQIAAIHTAGLTVGWRVAHSRACLSRHQSAGGSCLHHIYWRKFAAQNPQHGKICCPSFLRGRHRQKTKRSRTVHYHRCHICHKRGCGKI